MWKKIASWTAISIISLACLVMISVLAGRIGVLGYRTYSVVSGSMSPTLDVGDVVYVTDGEPKVGDIVVLSVDGQLVTHRIIGLEGGSFLTKGDANEHPDTFKDARITGIVRFHMPLLGYLALAGTGAHLSDRSSANVGIDALTWDSSTTTVTTSGEEGTAEVKGVPPMTDGPPPEEAIPDSPESSSTTTTTTEQGEEPTQEEGTSPESVPDDTGGLD